MKKKGIKTLLMSVIMSAPGPLILAIGLFFGKSNTQLADFIRRGIELLAIIASFVAYQITAKKDLSEEQNSRIEKITNLFVGFTMLFAGTIMMFITLFSDNEDKGNVIFGLIIALLGVTANSIFWIRYKFLSKSENSAILDVQSRLYRAKTLVDICVAAALLSLLIAPQSKISHYLDMWGSGVVAIYLAVSGIKIILEKIRSFK